MVKNECLIRSGVPFRDVFGHIMTKDIFGHIMTEDKVGDGDADGDGDGDGDGDDSDDIQVHKALFKQAMRHWENYTCIQVLPWTMIW